MHSPRIKHLIFRALEAHFFWASENLSGEWLNRLTDRYCDAVHRLRMRLSPSPRDFMALASGSDWQPLSGRYWELRLAESEAARDPRFGHCEAPADPLAGLFSGPRPPDYNDGTRDHV